MPDTLPVIDWPRLYSRVDSAVRLAPLGGRGTEEPASLPGRLWSRARSTVGLLFTARQKRFNLAVAAAVRDLCRAAEADRHAVTAGLNVLRDQLAQLSGLTAQLADAPDEPAAALLPARGRQPAWAHTTREAFEAACEAWIGTIPVGDKVLLARVLGSMLIYLHTADMHIAAWLANVGFWESWTSIAMIRNVRPGWRVADVGANCGYHTLLLAQLVGPTGRVLACEPNPDLAPLVARSAFQNGLSWATVFPGAVSDREGTATLHIPDTGGLNATLVSTPGWRTAEVPTRRLDDLCQGDRLDFVKIDVEGAEEQVWDGMAGLIARNPQITILLEYVAARYRDPRAFAARIAAAGFALRCVDFSGDIMPVTIDSLVSERTGEERLLWLSR